MCLVSGTKNTSIQKVFVLYSGELAWRKELDLGVLLLGAKLSSYVRL